MTTRKRPRDSRKVPKFLQPKYYREYLKQAMAEEGRGNQKGPRPIDQFSKACALNHHHLCHGTVDVDYTRKGIPLDREDCICHCHDDMALVD